MAKIVKTADGGKERMSMGEVYQAGEEVIMSSLEVIKSSLARSRVRCKEGEFAEVEKNS